MGYKAKSVFHNQKATDILENLRKDYPSYARIDEALFVLANSYIESQEMPKAGAVLSEIAERYPNSPVLKQASLLLGDFYFDKTQFAKAETYYQKAAQDEKIQSYVFYKMAWVSMNLNQASRALQYFEKVIALRAQAQASGGDYSKEAAREIVFPALEVHKVQGLSAYLDQALKDPELIRLSLNTAARSFMQKSDFSRASEVLSLLQKRYPESPENEDWVSNQLKAEEALGRTSEVKALVAKLGQMPGAASKIQAQVLNSAKKFHAEGQKASEGPEKVRLFDLAISYYEAFLQNPSTPEMTAQVHFFMGEALYARGRFMEASTHYELSSQTPSEVQAKAGWNWFLTAEKLAEGFKYQGKALQATTPNDEKYLAAAQAIQTIPAITLDQKRKASYQSARLLYQLNDLDRALPVFQALAERFAGTAEGKLSAQLVLDIYNLRQDFKSVAQYAKAYQAQADSGTKAEFGQLEQKALLKTIQEEEALAKTQTGDAKISAFASVAERYSDFVKNYPQSALVDGALWAALQNFAIVAAEKGGADTLHALKASFELLTTKYANSTYAPQAITLMGKFLSLRKISAEDVREFSRYRNIWEAQMQKEPREKRGLMAMLVFKLSNESQKRAMLKDFASLPKTEDNKEANAYVELEKVKALRDKLVAIPLTQLKLLKKNTAQKMELLDKLQADVTAVVKLQVAIPALEALKVLGDGYMKVAQSMRSAPIPKGLEGENLAKYREIVSGAAQDLEAKGKEALRLADEKSKEIDLSAT
jgi:tetratricopeptide (TPR) repeat protein